jgi:hypothetical protein
MLFQNTFCEGSIPAKRTLAEAFSDEKYAGDSEEIPIVVLIIVESLITTLLISSDDKIAGIVTLVKIESDAKTLFILFEFTLTEFPLSGFCEYTDLKIINLLYHYKKTFEKIFIIYIKCITIFFVNSVSVIC